MPPEETPDRFASEPRSRTRPCGGRVLAGFCSLRCATPSRVPGISLEGFDGQKEGDVMEFFTTEKIAQTSL
jgi:hypothetical protein